MKFLCICQYGHSRSVALTRVLHEMGYGAVAIGIGTNGGAIEPLSQWADVIAVLDDSYADKVPAQWRYKVRSFHVGPDRWSNPYNQELLGILKEKVKTFLKSPVVCPNCFVDVLTAGVVSGESPYCHGCGNALPSHLGWIAKAAMDAAGVPVAWYPNPRMLERKA